MYLPTWKCRSKIDDKFIPGSMSSHEFNYLPIWFYTCIYLHIFNLIFSKNLASMIFAPRSVPVLGAHVKWLRDGEELKSAPNIETKAEKDEHTLVIKKAAIDDVGEYVCQAENVTSKTELEVQSKQEKIEVENHIMQQMGIKGKFQNKCVIFWDPAISLLCLLPKENLKFTTYDLFWQIC